MDMSKMIFITGFARGGTSWLRDCVAFHPDVGKIPHEMLVFKDYRKDKNGIIQAIERAIKENEINSFYYVNKAPANSPNIHEGCELFPESKFLFIIRDPRDVLVSHQRGNKEWMKGANSTVQGCMEKTKKYYEGYLKAKKYPNLMLVKYEDLHQDFHNTLDGIYSFLGLEHSRQLIEDCFRKNNFMAVTGRRTEDRDAAARKGVINDWAVYLSEKEKKWYQGKDFWVNFFTQHEYNWEVITYYDVLKAMKLGGVNALSEDELLKLQLNDSCPNLLLMHDIDMLNTKKAFNSILELAAIEGELELSGFYNFLPLDDPRYRPLKPDEIVGLIKQISIRNSNAAIGLHLNAAEKYFPRNMEDVGDQHPDIEKAIDYLHGQVDEYKKHGITFRLATAHGYGRAKKRPNNRDTLIFTEELKKRDIIMFDTVLRNMIDEKASLVAKFTDVGGALSVRNMPNNKAIINKQTYLDFPPNSLIRFLIHPGNYDIKQPLASGLRFNIY